MTWIALIMLIGYERRRDADIQNHACDPLNDGLWRRRIAESETLMENARSPPPPPHEALDAILEGDLVWS
ncbi:MAG: hypothetical protein LBG43_01920 [Treponema sp.]|jgi:hypothetical protein|nr:hypothetical protein [Treponema sp.]